MRAIWTGSINFGLVNIPVKMYSGSQSQRGLDLDMLHAADHKPIRYAKVCRKDGKEIPYEDIVRGYKYQEGDYIVLTDQDLKKANVEKTKSIEIKQFASLSEIDIRYFEKPYYLEPVKGGEHAYALLRDALEKSGQVALGKYAMRARDNMGAIRPLGQGLVLEQMRFSAELRDPVDLNFPKDKAGPEELKIAQLLIDQMTKSFIPEDWHDTYTEDLEKIIKTKAKGKTPKTRGKEPVDTKSKDLMATLKASLEKA